MKRQKLSSCQQDINQDGIDQIKKKVKNNQEVIEKQRKDYHAENIDEFKSISFQQNHIQWNGLDSYCYLLNEPDMTLIQKNKIRNRQQFSLICQIGNHQTLSALTPLDDQMRLNNKANEAQPELKKIEQQIQKFRKQLQSQIQYMEERLNYFSCLFFKYLNQTENIKVKIQFMVKNLFKEKRNMDSLKEQINQNEQKQKIKGIQEPQTLNYLIQNISKLEDAKKVKQNKLNAMNLCKDYINQQKQEQILDQSREKKTIQNVKQFIACKSINLDSEIKSVQNFNKIQQYKQIVAKLEQHQKIRMLNNSLQEKNIGDYNRIIQSELNEEQNNLTKYNIEDKKIQSMRNLKDAMMQLIKIKQQKQNKVSQLQLIHQFNKNIISNLNSNYQNLEFFKYLYKTEYFKICSQKVYHQMVMEEYQIEFGYLKSLFKKFSGQLFQLNLSGMIQEQGMKSIFNKLINFTWNQVIILDLSFSVLTEVQWKQFCNTNLFCNLQKLNLAENQIHYVSYSQLKNLSINYPNLSILNLSKIFLYITTDGNPLTEYSCIQIQIFIINCQINRKNIDLLYFQQINIQEQIQIEKNHYPFLLEFKNSLPYLKRKCRNINRIFDFDGFKYLYWQTTKEIFFKLASLNLKIQKIGDKQNQANKLNIKPLNCQKQTLNIQNNSEVKKKISTFINNMLNEQQLIRSNQKIVQIEKYLNSLFKKNLQLFTLLSTKYKRQICYQLNKSKKKCQNTFLSKENTNTQIEKYNNNDLTKNKRMNQYFSHFIQKIYEALVQVNKQYQLKNIQDLQRIAYQALIYWAQQKKFLVFLNYEYWNSTKNNNQQIYNRNQNLSNQITVINQLINTVLQTFQQKIKVNYSTRNYIWTSLILIPLAFASKKVFPLILGGIQIAKLINIAISQKLNKQLKNNKLYTLKQYKSQNQIETLTEIILKYHIKYNIQQQMALSNSQLKIINQYLNNNKEDDFCVLNQLFSNEEKSLITKNIELQINQVKVKKNVHSQKIIQKLDQFFMSFSKLKAKDENGFFNWLFNSKNDSTSKRPHKNMFYFIFQLYKNFEDKYNTEARKLILRIGHRTQYSMRLLQKTRNQQGKNQKSIKFSVIHALKLIQSFNITYEHKNYKNRQLINKSELTQSQIKQIDKSTQQLLKQQIDLIKLSSNDREELIDEKMNSFNSLDFDQMFHKSIKLQLQSKFFKSSQRNVIILISGFLSKKDQFQQWQFLLANSYDSQVYIVQWESQQIKSYKQQIISACKRIIQTNKKYAADYADMNSDNAIFNQYVEAVLIYRQIYNKLNKNPFIKTRNEANIMGVYLAKLLIKQFQGRFISLVGFSFGTEVILSCLKCFKTEKKLSMINRVVTIGGTADKRQFISVLETTQNQSIENISISWTNVYCQNDRILKHLFKVAVPYIEPIGKSQVQQQQIDFQNQKEQQKEKHKDYQMEKHKEEKKLGIATDCPQKAGITRKIYQIEEINATDLVNGHFDYIQKMKIIGRLIGIKDD